MCFIRKWQKACSISPWKIKKKDEVVDIIVNSAKSGAYGHYGDGKIFVSDIEEAYTISEETREDED